MTYQFAIETFEDGSDDCCGAHVIHDNPYGVDLIYVAQHCDGSWTCNLQSANGSSGFNPARSITPTPADRPTPR